MSASILCRVQCDRAKALLEKNGLAGTKLRCMPDAGLFPGDDWRVPDNGNSWMADNMESKPGLNDECVAAYERNHSDWRICMRGAAALRYIKTPMFLLNSLYNWCAAYFVNALPVPSAMWKTMAEKISALEGTCLFWIAQNTHTVSPFCFSESLDSNLPRYARNCTRSNGSG